MIRNNSQSQEIVILFPHQLFEHHPLLQKNLPVALIEHARFFTNFAYHKQKLIFHRATMAAYQAQLIKKNIICDIIPILSTKELCTLIKKNNYTKIHCIDPVDTPLMEELQTCAQQANLTLQLHPTPAFLSPRQWLEEQLTDKNHVMMHHFYVAQRKRLSILTTHKKPQGGSWSFDQENRKKLPQGIHIPPLPSIPRTPFLEKALASIEQEFAHNPGLIEQWIYPITHDSARLWLENFLEKRLHSFGPYQDALTTNNAFLFHSLLSPLLNIGLLTPESVIQTTLEFSRHEKVPLNSLEGFIRQVIGWREFVYGVYLIYGKDQRTKNFFNHTRPLSSKFWSSTGIAPLDITLTNVNTYAYAHHIERLMILGNFMLLCNTHPDHVYQWFMSFFIDAYDWVMVPNVYGMSQYADGGFMVTKPYFSSSRYILNMSNYTKGEWYTIWDALYWKFVSDKKELLYKNPRTKMMAFYAQRLSTETLKKHCSIAEKFLENF